MLRQARRNTGSCSTLQSFWMHVRIRRMARAPFSMCERKPRAAVETASRSSMWCAPVFGRHASEPAVADAEVPRTDAAVMRCSIASSEKTKCVVRLPAWAPFAPTRCFAAAAVVETLPRLMCSIEARSPRKGPVGDSSEAEHASADARDALALEVHAHASMKECRCVSFGSFAGGR